MMVTILLGEQGAMIALSSHSDPPLIYFYLKRPVSSHRGNPLIYSDLRRPGSSHSGPPLIYSALDNGMDGYTSTRRGTEGETLLYDIWYGRLYGIKRSHGKAVLCIIGLWSFHRKKIADHVDPICSIVIMARLRTLIRDNMNTVR